MLGAGRFVETGGCSELVVWYVDLYLYRWMLGAGHLVCLFIYTGGCSVLVIWYVDIYLYRWMLGAGHLVC